MQAMPISAESILKQLNEILSSSLFANADLSRALLKFIVEQTVNERTDRLKEYTVGAEAFGRGASFDPRTDAIVRAEASRLRNRLERYYADEGRTDPVEITLPKGSYIPKFHDRVRQQVLADERDKNDVTAPLTPISSGWIPFTAAMAALSIAVWGIVVLQQVRSNSTLRSVVQFDIPQPPGTIFVPPIGRQPFAISPDGTRLAFTATGSTGTSIWVRDLARLEIRSLPGTEGAWALFWSPDSRSIFFSVKTSLKQANLDTNSVHEAASLPSEAAYGTWRSEGDLLLYLGGTSNYELLIKTGSLRKLADTEMQWAQFLPGSDRFIHVTFDQALSRYRAVATDYKTHESTNLLETDSRVQYAPPRLAGEPGYLLFLRGGTLLAQRFDAVHLRAMAEPIPIVQHIISFSQGLSACFSASTNGVLVYQTGFPLSELRWYDRAGHVIGATAPATFRGSLRISPDGHRVVATIWSPDDGRSNLWIFEQNGRESRRLTYPTASETRAVWSPDGKQIIFGRSRTGGPKLTSLEIADGAQMQELKGARQNPFPANLQLPTDWSRDGRFVAFDTSLGEDKREVWIANTIDGKAMPFLLGDSSQSGAVFSPDGKQVAFVSEQSGRPEVYVQAFEATPSLRLVGERRQISKEGAWLVHWRGDGRELFYAGIDSYLYAVPIERGVRIGEPKALFHLPGNPQYGTPTDFQFDVQNDGQQFVMTTTPAAAAPPFTVIQNWQDKVRR